MNPGRNPSSNDTSKKKKSKPKIIIWLTTITAVIIALTALVINIDKFVNSMNGLLNSVGLIGDVCTSIDCEVTIFQEIPFILNQTLKDRYYKRKRDYFWVLVEAENKCWWKKARVEVKFNLRKGKEFVEKASLMNEKVEFQLDSGESKSDTVDPELKLNTPDLEGEIDVKWQVTLVQKRV